MLQKQHICDHCYSLLAKNSLRWPWQSHYNCSVYFAHLPRGQLHTQEVVVVLREMPSMLSLITSQDHKACWETPPGCTPGEKQPIRTEFYFWTTEFDKKQKTPTPQVALSAC